MEPQENKSLALQKAIASHEQAEAALADLMQDGSDPVHGPLLERIQQNLADLRASAAETGPAEQV